MARLRQYFASRYSSQEATSGEFENIIRYLNSAEYGNQTVAELMGKLFDENGDVSLGINFRFDPSTGIEFQQDADGEWVLLAPADMIRGVTGSNIGTVEGPLLSNRQTFTAAAAQVNFSYTTTTQLADLMVWINGLLLNTADYSYSTATHTLTLLSPPGDGAVVMVATIRANPSASFMRVDLEAVSGQVVFPFPLGEYDEVIVLKNGILQREGGGYDYVKSPFAGTITMTSAQAEGTLITIIRISNDNLNEVSGLMLEDSYCTNGLIRLDRVAIEDGAIEPAKVNGLSEAFLSKPSVSVSTSTPLTAAPGDMWVNTAGSVPYMLFYDGVRWINSSPNGMIPLPLTTNALQYVRLNATATSLEYANVDLSSVLATATRGAANGVAPLDSSGLIPITSMPTFVSRKPISGIRSGAIVNGTFTIALVEDKFVVDGITLALSAGTATVQLSIGGALVGSTLGVTTTPTRLGIANVNIDASTVPKVVSLVVSGAATATDLAYVVGCLLVGD